MQIENKFRWESSGFGICLWLVPGGSGVCENILNRMSGIFGGRSYLCGFCKIAGKCTSLPLSQFCQPGNIIWMEQPVWHRRNIKKKGSVSTYRSAVNRNQLFKAFYLIIFFCVIKPARSYRGIDFGRIPDQILFSLKSGSASKILHVTCNFSLTEFLIICLLAFFLYALCQCSTGRNYTPLGFTHISGFIAAPADIRAAYTDAGVWLIFAHAGIIAFPVIDLFFAIWSLAAGTIQPDTEYFSVSGEQLGKLSQIVIIIFLSRSIAGLVPVPGGKIDSEFHAVTAAGIRNLFDYITGSLFPWA